MCLIMLAGWFRLEPVDKKFYPSSLVSIPTPPWRRGTSLDNSSKWKNGVNPLSGSRPDHEAFCHCAVDRELFIFAVDTGDWFFEQYGADKIMTATQLKLTTVAKKANFWTTYFQLEYLSVLTYALSWALTCCLHLDPASQLKTHNICPFFFWHMARFS